MEDFEKDVLGATNTENTDAQFNKIASDFRILIQQPVLLKWIYFYANVIINYGFRSLNR